jgi:hypothetical protein
MIEIQRQHYIYLKILSYLLHLELDGSLNFIDLLGHGFLMGKKTREFTSLVQSRAQKTGNLLNQRLAGQKGIVFLGYKIHKRNRIHVNTICTFLSFERLDLWIR